MKYQHRVIESKLQEYLSFFAVLGLTGPRQSGKSTLLLENLPQYRYVNFDDLRFVEAFYDDPEKFMRLYNDKVIFDEVQRVPELFRYIKIAVDQDRQNCGKFVLTGSGQFALMQNILESLAGRIGLLSLLPYQFIEIPEAFRKESIFRGCYPELVGKHYQLSADWFASYMDTYLNKDVRILANIGDLRDFSRFIHLLAANIAQALNLSRYASDLGVDVKTLKKWLSVLEASYILFLLPPYYNNFGKRIVKAPKVYFYDTGLVSYLVGISEYQHYEKGPMAGSLFENYIISEIYKRELHQKSNSELFYYRTTNGVEVDLIIDRKQYREFIEIKHSETYSTRMKSAISELANTPDQAVLIYQGETLNLDLKVRIVNYQEFLTAH